MLTLVHDAEEQVPDLTGAWAKLDRARFHLDTLCSEISQSMGNPASIPIPTQRRFDMDTSCVVWRVGDVPTAPDNWPLIVGDVLHNCKCALDHLSWQLATKHLGRAPTREERRDIQFPIVSAPEKWRQGSGGNHFLKFLDPVDIDLLERCQPFRIPSGKVSALEMLRELENEDKHRFIHMLLCAPNAASITNAPTWIDCEPVLQEGATVTIYHRAPNFPMNVGDEILRIPVTPTGPVPDVQLPIALLGHLAFEDQSPVIDSLDITIKGVAATLGLFASRSGRA